MTKRESHRLETVDTIHRKEDTSIREADASARELLHYENITFQREGQEILRGVYWDVKESENWAVVGLNGSGKSTMLSMIPAIHMPTSGILRVFGKEFGTCYWSSVKERIGFVSASLARFYQTLYKQTVEEIIISGRYHTIGTYCTLTAEDHTSANVLLKDFQLSHRRHHTFGILSTGEQRRTLLGRAVMGDPDLLILDEPCAGLDVKHREAFLTTLVQMSKRGIPFVYVTHQIEEIMPPVTHVAIVAEGQVVQKGPKRDILTDAVLSELYGVAVHVLWRKERPFMIVA